jgi:hypothetical protein
MSRVTGLYQAIDIKSNDTVGPIISAERSLIAVRTFLQAFREQTIIAQYPEDFALYEIGSQNKDTGEITPLSPPEVIITGEAARAMLERAKAENE